MIVIKVSGRLVTATLRVRDVARVGWRLLNGDEECESRWEWISVLAIAVVAVGTLGSYRGWWA